MIRLSRPLKQSPGRDDLDKKENKIGGTNLSTQDYGVNALSQRESAATSGTALGSTAVTQWAHDALGQPEPRSGAETDRARARPRRA